MVKTHREMQNKAHDNPHYCAFCADPTEAVYWSQNEQPDGEPQHPIVWHCQKHRWHGRKLAEVTVPTKRCDVLSYERNVPIKTRPITELDVITSDRVYIVIFIRGAISRTYRVTNDTRVELLDSLLKKYCKVTKVNLFSRGQASIWYNIK